MNALASYVQDRADELRDKPHKYYQWFYNEWLPWRYPHSCQPRKDRSSWPVDTYQADIALLAYLHAELSWKWEQRDRVREIH